MGPPDRTRVKPGSTRVAKLSMTTAAKVWSMIVPFHYFYEIQQQQWNIGAPLAVSAMPFAVLWAIYIAVPLVIGVPLLAKHCRDPEGWGER